MLSPYAAMVEKLYRDVEKEKITMLKIERAGDVLTDAVSDVFRRQFLMDSLMINLSFRV